MTIAQFIVAYSVCWWLVLFMVLPHKAEAPSKPGAGHAPSAPANPRLKRKFLLTSILAILPTVLIYFLSTKAFAEETIYHVGSGCETLEEYQPSADLNVKDGFGTGEKKVSPANLEQSTGFGNVESVEIPLAIPSTNYIDATKQNVDLSQSEIMAGKLKVGMDGSTSLNGRPIKNQSILGKDCTGKKDKQ